MPSGFYKRKPNMKTGKHMFGRKLSIKTKNKIGDFFRGIKLSKEHIEKIRLSNTGRKVSIESRKKMSVAKIGTKRSLEVRKKLSLSKQKENHPKWIKDRTLVKKQEERNNPNDKQWKYNVYKRDNFKCRISNSKCSGKLEAHHILSWRDHKELRFIINNGITLCHAHHPRKRAEEKRMIPVFQELLSVSKE